MPSTTSARDSQVLLSEVMQDLELREQAMKRISQEQARIVSQEQRGIISSEEAKAIVNDLQVKKDFISFQAERTRQEYRRLAYAVVVNESPLPPAA